MFLRIQAMCVLALFFSVPSFGSHFLRCTLQVDIVSLSNLNILGDTNVFSSSEDRPPSKFSSLGEIEVKEVVSDENCPYSVGDKITLGFKSDLAPSLEIGTTLVLDYKNIGDALISGISWKMHTFVAH